MKHCEAIDLEVTPTGAIFRGQRWPEEITVHRDLLDYLPGPHVVFGRMGILRFTALNGYGLYRRTQDVPGGWQYALIESNLKAEAKEGPKLEPKFQKVGKFYDRIHGPGGGMSMAAEAFQWLPHAVPPVELPEWFMHSDFQHVAAKGQLIIRSPVGLPMTANDGDFVVRERGKIFPMQPKFFTDQYQERQG